MNKIEVKTALHRMGPKSEFRPPNDQVDAFGGDSIWEYEAYELSSDKCNPSPDSTAKMELVFRGGKLRRWRTLSMSLRGNAGPHLDCATGSITVTYQESTGVRGALAVASGCERWRGSSAGGTRHWVTGPIGTSDWWSPDPRAATDLACNDPLEANVKGSLFEFQGCGRTVSYRFVGDQFELVQPVQPPPQL